MSRFTALLAAVLLFFCGLAHAGSQRVLIWLEGDALAEVHARSVPPLTGLFRPLRLQDSGMQAHREHLHAQREVVRKHLEQLGFVADGETDVVLHTLIGRMPEENIEAGRQVAGIRQLRPVKTYRLLMDFAGPVIEAPDGWLLFGGESQAGSGLKIAIVDTGIDITNPMLQDPNLKFPQGFPKGDPNFTNTKVIVARSYIAQLGDEHDIPDAMDREGHGTFVAGVAAGRRALGPLAEVAGVAPGAQLGNYRIFGSPMYDYTTDAVIIHAINDAVADGMNVINLSFGGSPGDMPDQEPVPLAVAAAVKAGVVVAVAAGNGGDYLASIGEPANVPSAITVGASRNARIFALPFQVTASVDIADWLKNLPAAPAYGTKPTSPLGPAPLWAMVGDPCKTLTGTDNVQGKIVLVSENTTCSGTTAVKNIAAAGAIAVVAYRVDNENPQEMYFYTTPAIPVFEITKVAGQNLAGIPGFNTGAQGSIGSTLTAFGVTPDILSSFSSFGPSSDNTFKPDLVAPGESIYSAFQVNDQLGVMYSLDQFGTSDGTSFSSPMVAGAAALVKQAHPFWTPQQIKSALVNAANPSVLDSDGRSPARLIGAAAGRLDVAAAINAVATFEPTGLSFSNWLLTSDTVFHRPLTITNVGKVADSFTINVVPLMQVTGGSVTVTPGAVSLGPSESATVDVAYTAVHGSKLHEMDGRLQIQAGSGTAYSVPYWGRQVTSSDVKYIAKIRGNGQSAPVSSKLPRELAVQVYDTPDIVPVAGATVTFQVTTGSATVSADSVTTDDTGVASITVQMSDVPGPVNVTASLSPTRSTVFYLTARPLSKPTSTGVANAWTQEASGEPQEAAPDRSKLKAPSSEFWNHRRQ